MLFKELFNRLLFSFVFAGVAIGLLVYGMRVESTLIQALGIIVVYLGVNSFSRVQGLLLISVLVGMAILLKIPLQATELFRVSLFSLVLTVFVNGRANRSPFSFIAVLWFVYLSMHLLPIAEINAFIVGLSPIPTVDTLHFMFAELMAIAVFGLAPSSRRVRKFFGGETESLSISKLLTHCIAVPMTLVIFVTFKLIASHVLAEPNLELTSLPYMSSMILMVSALLLVVFHLTIRKTASELRNVFRHLEICATPDSTFLALSKKQPLPLVEYDHASAILRQRAQAIVSGRRKATEMKLEVSNLKRALLDENSHASDLYAISNVSHLGYLAINLDGIVTFANETFCEMFDARWKFEDFMQYSEVIPKKTEWGRHLHFVLDWSILNFESLGEAKECPFAPREAQERNFEVVTKSFCHISESDQSYDLGQERIFLYVREVASVKDDLQEDSSEDSRGSDFRFR